MSTQAKWLTAAITGTLMAGAGLVLADTSTETSTAVVDNGATTTTITTTTTTASNDFGSNTGHNSGREPGTTNNSRAPEDSMQTTVVASTTTNETINATAAVDTGSLPTEPTSAGTAQAYTEPAPVVQETASAAPREEYLPPRADRN